MKAHSRLKLVIVLKGYPRLSETFIAQEILGLEQIGIELVLVSLRHPTDIRRHAMHNEIQAPVVYLPEYLHDEPLRVLRAMVKSLRRTGIRGAFFNVCKRFIADLRTDFTRNRVRRFGQAIVLAAEWPEGGTWLHAHFIHTPASVAQYASGLLQVPWTVSAHAKDIWTSNDRELSQKLGSAKWAVTCTRVGHAHLQALAPQPSTVHLSYHGLDLERFPPFKRELSVNEGSCRDQPVTILSVGRAVDKKGFDILLHSLADLPEEIHWRLVHVGDGAQLKTLKSLAGELSIAERISWQGAITQQDLLGWYRSADIFALACRVTADGDRDGLPNVLVEAASQGLTCISTTISGIPELFVNQQNALLVESEDHKALSSALETAIRSPGLRAQLGNAVSATVRSQFDYKNSIEQLCSLFEAEWPGQA